jgi:hypothetical protein
MLSFIIDTYGGYLVAKKVRSIWLLILFSILVGIGSAIVANLLLGALGNYWGDLFSPMEQAQRIVLGLILHPLLSLLSALVCRGCGVGKNKSSPADDKKISNTPSQIYTFKETEEVVSSGLETAQVMITIPAEDIFKTKGDESFWARADEEIKGEPQHDLWVKCLYASEQDESKAKLLYVHERVEQLKDEESKMLRKIDAEEEERLREADAHKRKQWWAKTRLEFCLCLWITLFLVSSAMLLLSLSHLSLLVIIGPCGMLLFGWLTVRTFRKLRKLRA